MSNKALWDRAFKTDPKQVKAITGKQYSGNSPKPYYIVERLTEELGPCGIGWGFEVVNERFERFSETDVLHVALIAFWYELDGKRGRFQQMGQTKASYITSKGSLLVDEDAPKKSVTDALVKCASYLGFAGDIFSGRWDDSKYVNELRKEFAEQAEGKEEGSLVPALEASIAKAKKSEAARTTGMRVRFAIQEHLAAGRELGALGEWQALHELENAQEVASIVWGGLTTPERDEIRRLQNEAGKVKA